MIGRIGPLDLVQPENRPERTEKFNGGVRADSIDVSQKAKEKAELYQVTEMIKATPELDESQIAAIRERINDPAYFSERTISATANRIMDAFGLL